MRVSVVTIVYNDEAHICATIESVLSQSVRSEIEYIIVDGQSTDGTSERIAAYHDRIDIYIREQDSGIYNAMNKGLAHSTGDYVVFMNSGDRFCDSNVIKTVISTIENHPEKPALVYGDYREVKEDKRYTTPIPSRTPAWIWYGPVASHQSTFYNLAFLHRHGLSYDESYRIAADYKLTLEVMTRAADDVLRIPVCISDFDTTGCSNTNQDLGLNEANRARQEVLGWGMIRITGLTIVLRLARFIKEHCSPLYKLLRH